MTRKATKKKFTKEARLESATCILLSQFRADGRQTLNGNICENRFDGDQRAILPDRQKTKPSAGFLSIVSLPLLFQCHLKLGMILS